MPEPNHKDPIPEPAHATTYGYQSLDTLRRQGVQFVEFWCVGGQAFGRRCEHRESKRIDDLLRTLSLGTNLVMMARRARCARCKKLGCHVRPAEPPVYGQPGYRDHLRAEMERYQRFLVWAREQL